MTEDKFLLPDCPLEYATNIIGGKWKIRLIWALYEAEYVRFNQLKRQLNGITDMMLTKILKELVKEDIVKSNILRGNVKNISFKYNDTGIRAEKNAGEVVTIAIETGFIVMDISVNDFSLIRICKEYKDYILVTEDKKMINSAKHILDSSRVFTFKEFIKDLFETKRPAEDCWPFKLFDFKYLKLTLCFIII